MRCLQMVLEALSLSNCSFYTSNKDPDTAMSSSWGELDVLLCTWLCGHPSPVALGTSNLTAGGSASQTSPYPLGKKISDG